MSPMSPAAFEARYRADPDPWRYQSSPYERKKYAATLAACGAGPFASALELGGSIGVFSAQLAPRCRRLTTIDGAPSAVSAARLRVGDRPQANVILGEIPGDIPRRPYDLVVASEILYYFSPARLDATLAVLSLVLARGGRLVAVHWRPAGAERPFTAEQIHARLRAEPWLEPRESRASGEYLLDTLERT